jgi:nicotinate-nucleotide pyrophosphorylase (carboxylating)
MAERLPLPTLYPVQYQELIEAALREDLGRAGDRTSDAIVPVGTRVVASIVARRAGVVAGIAVAEAAFRQLDPAIAFTRGTADGQAVSSGDCLLSMRGDARAILAAERTALNFIGRLCGIATVTADIVARVAGTGAAVVCTRKTTPLLRALEKYAVRCGGGASHRYGLDDAILIKDNHRVIAGSATEAVRRARAVAGHLVKIEIEVDDLGELETVLALGVDVVLLDNLPPDDLRRAVAMRDASGTATLLEASGGITPENARAKAASGVDLLSIGWLTHSAPVLDLGLDFAAG